MNDTIKKAYDDLVEERTELLKSTFDLHIEKEKELLQLRARERQYNDVCEKIKGMEHPRLGELDNQIAALARLLPNHVKAPV